MMNKKDLMGKTKKALVDMLKGFEPKTKEDKDIITYTLDGLKENSRNVTKPELVDIISDLFNPTILPVECKVKATKTEKEAEQEILSIIDEKPVENKKKVVKKAKKEDKKEQPKEEEVTSTKEDKKETTKTKEGKKKPVPVTKEVVVSFPKEFKSTLGTIRLREDIKDIKQFAEEIENDVPLVIGAYWSKTQLRQFEYDHTGIGVAPKEFKNDLDILDVYYASENVVYGISVYTECNYAFLPAHFTLEEDTGMRYAFGIEFQVYEIVEEADEE